MRDVEVVVVQPARAGVLISARIWTRSFASRFESGSSKRNTAGWRTIARPSATRWRWPPESCRGLRSRSSREPERRRRLGDAAVDLVAGDLAQLEPEREVVAHRHVRIERVVLEDHRDVAVARRDVVDAPAADRDLVPP